jgi:hypothetical protein
MIKNFGIKDVDKACEKESRRVRSAHYVMTPQAQQRAKNQLKTFKRKYENAN